MILTLPTGKNLLLPNKTKMTDQITEYFEQGILAQAYQAERNILIWQYVANEVEFLEKQNEYRCAR